MAGVVVGMIRSVDEARRVVVIGDTEFWLPDSLSMADLAPGTSVTMTYEVTGSQHVATDVRTNPPY